LPTACPWHRPPGQVYAVLWLGLWFCGCFFLGVAFCPPSAHACGGRSPICIPRKPAGRKWGKDNFNLGKNKNIHSNVVFPFPQIRTLYLGEGREGGYYANASLNTDSNNPSTPAPSFFDGVPRGLTSLKRRGPPPQTRDTSTLPTVVARRLPPTVSATGAALV